MRLRIVVHTGKIVLHTEKLTQEERAALLDELRQFERTLRLRDTAQEVRG